MILRYFTQNHRGLLFFFPVLIGLLSISLTYFLPPHPILTPQYASEYLFHFSPYSAWTYTFILFIIVTVCAAIVNAAFNNSELYFQPSFLVGFLSAVIFTISSFKLQSLSWVIAQLCLTLSLFFSLQIQNQKRIYPALFSAQIFIGISICIYPQNIGFAIALNTILLTNRSFSLKESLFSIIILMIPLIYWLSFCYLNDRMEEWFFWSKTHHAQPLQSIFSSMLFWISSVCLMSALVGIFKKENRQTNKTQQAKNTLLIFLFSSILSGVICWSIQEPFTFYNFNLPFIVIVGYYWTHYRVSLMAPFLFYFWLLMYFLFAFEVIQ